MYNHVLQSTQPSIIPDQLRWEGVSTSAQAVVYSSTLHTQWWNRIVWDRLPVSLTCYLRLMFPALLSGTSSCVAFSIWNTMGQFITYPVLPDIKQSQTLEKYTNFLKRFQVLPPLFGCLTLLHDQIISVKCTQSADVKSRSVCTHGCIFTRL